MKNCYTTYPAAEDSLAYKLHNAIRCEPLLENEYLGISYWHHQRLTHKLLSFSELNTLHPGLPDAIVCLHATKSTYNNDLLVALCATVNHLDGNFIDLRVVPLGEETPPFLTNIEEIHSTDNPNIYRIEGLRYFVGEPLPCGIRIAEPDHYAASEVSAEVMELLWPESTRQLRLMESLGYDDHEIITTILTGGVQRLSTMPVDADIQFD